MILKSFLNHYIVNYSKKMSKMAEKENTQHLLEVRSRLQERLEALKTEITDLEAAIEKIDEFIVKQGFRRLSIDPPRETVVSEGVENSLETFTVDEQAQSSIKSKNGTTLGVVVVQENVLRFQPSREFNFEVEMPPFQSFFIDRVLENMRKMDQERAENSEIELDEILTYEVSEDGGLIKSIEISNFRDERRMSEIRSSLRWTLDKMYDKIIEE